MNRRVAISALLVGLLSPGAAAALDFSERPVRIIVPFPAGGPADLFARIFAGALAPELGQQVIIEHRAGSGGLTGVDSVAKSAPDGYTIGLSGSAALSSMPFMVSKMPFDWQKDLALITLVARVPEVLAVHPSTGVTTLRELVAHARDNPRKINFGSAGTGTITHLAVELLKSEAEIDLVHVPYRGAAPAVNDLVGGHIQMAVFDVPVLLPHIRSGALKPLAVTSRSRSDALPNVPTTAEAGFKSVLSDNWYGLVAPAGTAIDVLDKLHRAAISALQSSDLKKQFGSQNAVSAPMTPADFASFVAAEQAKWGPVVLATGAKIQ